MAFISEMYPPRWRAVRRIKLEQVGYCCEECGIAHLSTRQNTKTGEDYLVYLSIAHKKQYQTWMKEADTMVLCQRCHRRYDRQFRRKGKARTCAPIGYAKVLLHDDGQEVVAGVFTTYSDLRDLLDALPDGTAFVLHLVMNMAIVGNGSYLKQSDEAIEVLSEYGACVGFPF